MGFDLVCKTLTEPIIHQYSSHDPFPFFSSPYPCLAHCQWPKPTHSPSLTPCMVVQSPSKSPTHAHEGPCKAIHLSYTHFLSLAFPFNPHTHDLRFHTHSSSLPNTFSHHSSCISSPSFPTCMHGALHAWPPPSPPLFLIISLQHRTHHLHQHPNRH